MAGGAGRPTEEERLAAADIAHQTRATRWIACARGHRKAADVRHHLPRLVIRQSAVRRHLRTWHTVTNHAEEIAIVVSSREDTARQRGAAVALSSRPMTSDTRLVVETTARCHGRRARAQWIACRVGL